MASRVITFAAADSWVEVANPASSDLWLQNTGAGDIFLAQSAAAPADDFNLAGAIFLRPGGDLGHSYTSGESLYARARDDHLHASLSVT